MGRARAESRGSTLWFSIAKGLEKDLDRFGRNSATSFVTLSEEEVQRFVQFDMAENVFLAVGPILLSHGAKGIPIGGFLSTQIAEIWACWREFTSLFGEHVSQVQVSVNAACATFSRETGVTVGCDIPGAPEVVCHHPGAEILAHNMFVAKNVHQATPEALCQSRFIGWWTPADRTFATATVADKTFQFISTTPWDGAEGGRLRSIIRHSTGKNRRLVMKFFENFDALNGVVGEILSAVQMCACAGPMPPSQPAVIMSRYRDNIYIALVGISPCFVAPLTFIIEQMTFIIYGIPLKLEPHGYVTTWGEAAVIFAHRTGAYLQDVALHRKGVVHDLEGSRQGATDAEWEQWVDAHSPNARTVLKSFLPSVFYKSLLYALSPQDVTCNLRSLLWRLGVRAYPDQWWRPLLLRFFKRFRLHGILGFKVLIRWFHEGGRVVIVNKASRDQTPVHRC